MTEQINGYIDHDYKGHKVRLYGTVVGINEGDKTANMVFENGVSANGIPMEVIQIDEASLEGIKNAAHRAWGWLKGKFEVIGGMVKKIWNGIAIPFNRAVNIGQLAAAGGLPSGVGFYPSPQAYAEAQEAGVKISEQNAPDRDGEDSNGWNEDEAYRQFWRNIFKKIIKFKNESNSSVTSKVVKDFYLKEVQEKYGTSALESLKNNPWLNNFFGLDNDINEMEKYIENRALQILHEQVDSGDAGIDAYRSENIPNKNMSEIVELVMTQLKIAFEACEFNFDTEDGQKLKDEMMLDWFISETERLVSLGMEQEEAEMQAAEYANELFDQYKNTPKKVKPVMIWGAPGIGKTSIIQQCKAMFKQATKGEGTNGDTNGYNINMLEVVLSKMSSDDFTLPTKGEDELTGDSRAVNAIQSWLPCWHVSGNKKLDKLRNRAANLMLNTPQVLKNHGIDIKGDIENWQKNWQNWQENGNNSEKAKVYRTDTDFKRNFAEKEANGENDSSLSQLIKNHENKKQEHQGRKPRKITESLFSDRKTAMAKLQQKNERIRNNKKIEDSVLTDGGVIFFDEFTRAPKGVSNVLMNLLNDRKIGEGWVLGSHWIIVCAGNRFWEMTQMDDIWEKAHGTRLLQMTFVPKWEDWKNWAMGYRFDPVAGRYDTSKKRPNKIDQEIIDFLETTKQQGINAWYEKTDSNVDKSKSAKTYANPRTWQSASDLMVARVHEINPENPYIRDPITGTETINLPREEKMKCIEVALGQGSDTYGQYQTWTNNRYYTPEMIQNIINTGTITGKKTDEVRNIETNGKVKKALPRDVADKMMDNYIPKRKDTKGKSSKIMVDGTTLTALSDQIFNAIDWANITNIQVANLLCYFAIVGAVCQPGNTKFFDNQWKKIFTHLTSMYLNLKKHKQLDELPEDLQEALKQALGALEDGTGDKDKYMKWMAPCHQVFLFVNGWEGMDDGKEKYAEELSKANVRDEIEAD